MSRLATLSDPCAADLQEARTKLGQAVKTRRGFHNGRIRPGAIGRVVQVEVQVRYCYSVSDTTEAIPDVEAQEPTLLVQWDKTGEVDEFSLEAYELYMQEI